MPTNVLNIAAGLLPIVATDLRVDNVVNYDPLSALANADKGGRRIVSHLMVLSKAFGDIKYARRQAEVDRWYPNSSVDLVLSVSPYGFTLINEWVHRKINICGYVVVIGNLANKFIKQDQHLFESGEIFNSYVESTPDNYISEPWVDEICKYVMKNARSFKTDPNGRATELNKVRIFQRIPDLV